MMYYSPNINLQRSNLKSRHVPNIKEAKDQGKHIMIEFSPGRYRDGESIAVDLVPVPPKQKPGKNRSVDPIIDFKNYDSALDYLEDRENFCDF